MFSIGDILTSACDLPTRIGIDSARAEPYILARKYSQIKVADDEANLVGSGRKKQVQRGR